jgi:hypothetical protein
MANARSLTFLLVLWLVRAALVALWLPTFVLLWGREDWGGVVAFGLILLAALSACRPSEFDR